MIVVCRNAFGVSTADEIGFTILGFQNGITIIVKVEEVLAKTKLLFVINSMGLGGAQKALVTLLNEIDYDKYEVHIQLCDEGGFNLKYIPDNVIVHQPFVENNEYYHRFPLLIKEQFKKGHFWVVLRRLFYAFLAGVFGKGTMPATQYFQWRFVRKYVSMHSEQFDVSIGYLDGLPHYYAIDKVNAKKKICWVHNDYSKMPTYKGVFKYLSKADEVVTISPQCVDELKKMFPKLNNVNLVYNLNSPTFIKKLAQESLEEDFIVQNGEPRVLCIGRLCEQKAYHLAIEAAKILKSQGYNFNWSIIGNGHLFDELSRLIKENGVEEVFHLLGVKLIRIRILLRQMLLFSAQYMKERQ